MTFIMLPVDSGITQPFGVNPTRSLAADHPTIRTYGNYQPWGHDGIDFGCWEGTPVRVPGRGQVAFSGFGVDMPYDVCIKYGMTTDPASKWSSGIIVILDHGNGIASYYAHLSRSDLDHRVGQWVEAGTVMGLSGNTGRSGGPHLHWSTLVLPINYQDGLYSRRNPLDYVTTVNVIPIAPGNTGAPSTSKEPFTVDQYKQIMAKLDRIEAIATENQRRITSTPAKVWAMPVRRGGKQIAALQELADAKSLGEAIAKTGATKADVAAAKGTVNVVVSKAEEAA